MVVEKIQVMNIILYAMMYVIVLKTILHECYINENCNINDDIYVNCLSENRCKSTMINSFNKSLNLHCYDHNSCQNSKIYVSDYIQYVNICCHHETEICSKNIYNNLTSINNAFNSCKNIQIIGQNGYINDNIINIYNVFIMTTTM